MLFHRKYAAKNEHFKLNLLRFFMHLPWVNELKQPYEKSDLCLYHCMRTTIILWRFSAVYWLSMACVNHHSKRLWILSISFISWIFINHHSIMRPKDYLPVQKRPVVGVTKAPFVIFSDSAIFDLAKVPIRFFESRPYLTGVTAAELRWHLSNINMIFNS